MAEDMIERAAWDYALAEMRTVWPPHPKMSVEQADKLAEVAARMAWRAYGDARKVLAKIPRTQGEQRDAE